mgnify:CR=1 FL=1
MRMEILGYIVALIFVFAAIAVAWRFMMFRNSGAQGLIRSLPADGVHGWRHGVVRYVGEEARFYKLRSLSFNYDMSIDRRDVTFNGVRDLTDDERDIMPQVEKVLSLSGPMGQFEFAGQRHAEMALISWVESAPDSRAQREDMNALAQRANRGRR